MPKFIQPDKESFIALATTKIPFGKYRGLRLVDLPEKYLVWFSKKMMRILGMFGVISMEIMNGLKIS